MLLAVRISSYGCTWEVWRALKKLLSCSPNFPRASITRYTNAKHEPILKWGKIDPKYLLSEHGDLCFLLYFSKQCLVGNIQEKFEKIVR